MSQTLIRRMREEDLDQVILLDCMSFSLPWPPSAYLHELNDPDGRVWVAEQTLEQPLEYRAPFPGPVPDLLRPAGGPAVVGVVVVWLVVDEAHIATLAVHPELRRRGLGRRLLCTALTESAQAGAVSALLEVRAGNAAAQGLYQHFGFEVVGRRAHYYRDNHEDALLMTLPDLSLGRLRELC
ncbi:MAG TPA: ribosomal protein S18-alanine N-acetyltransferase [Streptosporangiaceae bacterium]|nr:ribosomal protein S18-alanine N-acetyltransferase [Streptosporangiaceae bacterium]